MKEKNAFNQLKLAQGQHYWRQKQIDTITEAANQFEPAGESKQVKIFVFATVYLAFIAQFLENALKVEVESTQQSLNKLPELVSEEQIDCCISTCLGSYEAANAIGLVVTELLTKAHRCMTHATALALGQDQYSGLPLFANDSGEDLVIACMETGETALAGMARNVKKCIALAEKNEVRAQNVQEFLTPSISSFVNACTMTSSAAAFKKAALIANQPFELSGIFENDPSHNAQTKEIQIGRALAAGYAADVIISNLQNIELWNEQSLN